MANTIVSSGITSNGISITSGNTMTVSSGGTANNTTVNSGGSMVLSGGTANNTTLNCYMDVSSGGVANSTTVNGWGGYLWVSNGGTANNTTVNSYGYLQISWGGVANSATLDSYGRMQVFSGATATNIAAASGVELHFVVASNTYVQGTSGGSAFEMKNAFLSGYTFDGGSIVISSGGTANSIMTDSGNITVLSGGVADGVTVGFSCTLDVYSGATVTNIVASNGAMLWFAVASDTYVQGTSGGSAFEMKNAFLSGYAINENGWINVFSGGTADSIMVNSFGQLGVYNGGVANSTTVNSCGGMQVFSGMANNTTVKTGGNMCVDGCGTVNGVTVSSGAWLEAFNGGRMTGRMTFESGARVSAYEGTVLDFDLTGASAGDAALVNDLSLVQGTPIFTLTVDAPLYGTYVLAGGASGFDSTITVLNTLGEELGVLSVGSTDIFWESAYTLSLQDEGTLTLSVDDAVVYADMSVMNELCVVNPGELYRDTIVTSCGVLEVSAGGRTRNTIVGDPFFDINQYEMDYMYYYEEPEWNGIEIISGGATAEGTTICGGSQMVYGTAKSSYITGSDYWGMYISFWQVGSQCVLSGGKAVDTYMDSGYQYISAGGSAENTLIAYGCQYVMSDGVAKGNIIKGGAQYVYSGGSILQETISGGAQHFSGYGEDIDVIRGSACLYSNGQIRNIQIHSGATMIIAGGSATGVVQDSGGHMSVSFLSNAYVQGSNQFNTFSVTDRVASGFVFYNGSYQTVSSGGTMVDPVLFSGAVMHVKSTGKVSGGVLASGASIYVSKGGAISGLMVNNDASLIVAEGSATGLTVLKGGNAVADFNGYITGTSDGSAFSIQATNVTQDFTVISGYTQIVNGSKTANRTTVLKGGSQVVSYGGLASGTILSNTARQSVSSGGSAVATEIRGGFQYALRGANVSGTVIYDGELLVSSGAVTRNTIVSGGSEYLQYSASAIGTVIRKGSQYLSPYATAENTIVAENGVQVVGEGYNYGYYDSTVSAYAKNTHLSQGGIQRVEVAGVADGTVISAGGSLVLSNTGSAVNIQHLSGGILSVDLSTYYTEPDPMMGVDVSSGCAFANGTNEKGEFSVVSGTGTNLVLYSGAVLSVGYGMSAVSTTISSGGVLAVQSGGVVISANVEAGGQAFCDSNTSFLYGHVASGGVLVVSGTHVSDVTLDKGAEVRIDFCGEVTGTSDGQDFHSSCGAVISGFEIKSGYSQVLSSGYRAEKTHILSGGILYVRSGGIAADVVQDSGGILYADLMSVNDERMIWGTHEFGAFSFSRGVASNFLLNQSASVTVGNGAALSSSTIRGGNLRLSSGTAADINQLGGVIYVGDWNGGATIRNVNMGSGSWIYVYSNSTIGGSIHVGGTLYFVGSNISAEEGTAITIHAGMDSVGSITYLNKIASLPNVSFSIEAESGLDGRYQLASGISSSNTLPAFSFSVDGIQLSDLRLNESVFCNGARYTLSRNGDYLYLDVTANVSEESVQLLSGESVVYCGPVADSMRIVIGETQLVKKSGRAVDTLVDFGGTQQVASGGRAVRTTVMGAGKLVVESDGTVSSATIQAGGSAVVSGGGAISSLTLSGNALVESNGEIRYADIAEGGELQLAEGAVLSGTITVSGKLSAEGIVGADGARLSLNLNKNYALLNSLDYFGEAAITLHVSSGETGVFLIAEQAPSESISISVAGVSGALAMDSARYSGDYRYALSSESGGLELEVKEVHADFEVSDFIVPTAFAVGENTSFGWTLTNNGERPLDGVRQSLYVVDADDPNRKMLLKSVYITTLPDFGETVTQTVDVPWSDTIGYANSLFQLVVEADGDVSPDNNTAISSSQYHFEQKLSIGNLSGSIVENAGRIRLVARRTGSPDQALSAEIVLTDVGGLVSAPQTVTFAAGESEKVFYLTVGDNAEYQGNTDIQVGLQAQGYEGYSQTVTLADDEMPSLSFEVAGELSEGDAIAMSGKVKLDYVLDHDLRVKLTYDKTQLSGIPDYVVIKAGETEAEFALTVIDDVTAEIDKTVKLTATADGVKSGTASLLIHDNDVPAIALSVNKNVVSEGDGAYALVGTITRTDDTVNYVKVKLVDADNSGLILPDIVTLGTGAKSVNFYIGIVDNKLVDGDRTATVKANIYIDSCGCTVLPVSGETQVSFTILNDDGETLGLSFDKANVAENTVGAAKLTITRNTVDGDALTVNLSVSGSSLLELPATVQFEAGQNSVTIDVNTLTDGVNTGNQMAVVTVSAEGYASAAGYLNIADVDLPDFSVSGISLKEEPAYAGKTSFVNLTLENNGFQAYSGNLNVRLSLSDGTDLGTYKVSGPFGIGESKQVGFYVNMPEITGMQTILAEVDPGNLVSELNDGNNTALSAPFEVKFDYVVTVETEPEVLYTKAPITVTGTTKRLDGTAVGNMSVEVFLKATTGEKLLKTTSDADGNFTLTVDPSDLYAGSYAVYAGNLGSYGAAQDRVEIAGMKVSQPRTAFTWDVENTTTTEGSFTISNLSGVALSGVTIRAVNAPDNFVFVSDEPAALDANGQLTVNYTITAAGETEGGGYELAYGWQKIDFVAESDEGVTTEFCGYFFSNPQTSVLTLSETKDVRTLYSGKESFYEFQITNTGFGDTGEIRLNLPENDLIKIISNPVIENLAYGESATVTLKINPVALHSLELNAPYTGSIGISAENADSASFAFDYTFVTNDKGSITITLTDEWTQYAADHPMLSGAKVGVYNAYTEKLVTTGYTDENGVVNFSDLAEGKYILKYSADGHNNAQQVVTVRGGETLEVNTFLQVSTVKYSWEVRPVELTDSYEIVLSTEFETNVPAPVVTIDGPTVLPELAWGESTLMNFTVTNHGLIAAQDFIFELPEIGNGYSWRVLNDQPVDIAPNSAITVTVQLVNGVVVTTDPNTIRYYITDKDGNPLGSIDDEGEFYVSGYDANNNKVSYDVYKDGIMTSYVLNEDGEWIVENPANYYVVDGIKYYKTDMEGNSLSQSDTTTDSTTIGYDADGNMVFYSRTQDGKTESFYYDENQNLSSKVLVDGTTITYTYDDNGTLTEEYTSLGYHFLYDAEGNVSSCTDSDGHVTTYTYDENGNRIASICSDGSNCYYDAEGRVVSCTSSDGSVSSYSYDSNGNLLSVTVDGKTAVYSYSENGENLIGNTDLQGNVYSYSYDDKGRQTSISVNGKITQYTYDAIGNCTSVTNAAGETSFYEFDENNNMTKFIDMNGNSISFAYNEANDLTQILYADGTSECYTYDADGRMTGWTGRSGQNAAMVYDANGNLLSTTYSDGTIRTFTYDAAGNRITANDITFSYDEDGDVTGLVFTDGRAVNYSYTVDGLIAGYTDESGHGVNYTYTEDGLYDILTDESGALVIDYDYDDAGQLVKATRGNGTYSTYAYDQFEQVTAIENYSAVGTLESYVRYTYDSEGKRTAMETQDGAWAYAYDVKDQLTGAVFTNKAGQVTQEFSYEYDAAGNRTRVVENGVVTTYTYNNLNQIVSANGFAYRYDANGNLLEDEKRTYTWTADNRVASETLKSTGQVWEYGYDAMGNRVSSKTNGITTTWTVDENGNVIAEYVNGIWNRTYYQGDMLAGFTDRDGASYYFNSDALGTTLSVTGNDGSAVNTYSYDPFGNVLESTEGVDNDFTYVGGYGLMKNDSGTYFVRARNYDPGTGRWISPDPIGLDGGENPYAYCGNNPASYIDVYGNFFGWWGRKTFTITIGNNNLHQAIFHDEDRLFAYELICLKYESEIQKHLARSIINITIDTVIPASPAFLIPNKKIRFVLEQYEQYESVKSNLQLIQDFQYLKNNDVERVVIKHTYDYRKECEKCRAIEENKNKPNKNPILVLNPDTKDSFVLHYDGGIIYEFTIDASKSYDQDEEDNGKLTYYWTASYHSKETDQWVDVPLENKTSSIVSFPLGNQWDACNCIITVSDPRGGFTRNQITVNIPNPEYQEPTVTIDYNPESNSLVCRSVSYDRIMYFDVYLMKDGKESEQYSLSVSQNGKFYGTEKTIDGKKFYEYTITVDLNKELNDTWLEYIQSGGITAYFQVFDCFAAKHHAGGVWHWTTDSTPVTYNPNKDDDCSKTIAGVYNYECQGTEYQQSVHCMTTSWCDEDSHNSAPSGSSPSGGGGAAGGVPAHSTEAHGAANGSMNTPSIATTTTSCNPYVKSDSASATPDGGLMSAAAVLTASAEDGEPDSICAHVKVEFKQTAVMSREGFEGTLTLTNEAATEMTNVVFTATVLNSAGEDVSDLFEIAYNGADGFSITQNGDLEEYGLGNKETGTFTVLYVPGRFTATEGPEDYQFTGTLSYTDSLIGDVTIDLTPISLTVNPSPALQLHYFVERDVYADDPFTDAIEKSVPAEISVLVVNTGKGDARNLSLSGLTPEIVENQKGLLLNYSMTDAAMNGVKNNNGIADVNFGTVAANSSAVAQWWYETNVQGHYSDYSVNFTQMDYSYVDLYGNVRYVAAANRPDVSLIESADIHELIRSVQAGDDELPDFLVDDLADDGDTPDTLYLSTGAVEDVNAVFAATSSGNFGTNDVTITLTADFEAGWNYLRILDPGNGDYELTGIVRDGEALNVRNYWQTDRYYLDELGVKYENRLHLLDHAEQAGTVEYTLTYTARDKNPLSVTSITGADAVVKNAVGSLTVTFNKAVNASSFTWQDIDLFRQGDLTSNLITDAVTVTKTGDATFEIGNLGDLTAADGYYQLIVRTDGITDTVGNAGSDGKALTWTMASTVPAVASIAGIDDVMNSKADSFEVTFTASVDAATLTPAVFLINGVSSDGLVIAPVGESNTKFTVSGISGLLTEGVNTLTIDLTQVTGINGNVGLQTSSREWTIDLTAPAVQEISESLGVSGAAPAKLVFEATEDVTVSADALTLKKDGVAVASDSMNVSIDGKKIIVTGINILSDGAYELELALDKIADAAGNTGSGTAVKTWTIDKTAPAQVAGFSLAAYSDLGESDSDGRTSTRDLTLVGTLPEAGLRVRIYQQAGTKGRTLLRELTPDGTAFETAVKVQGGHSVLVAELTDAAGNTSETALSVFVDELAVSAEFQEKFKEVLTGSPQAVTFKLSEEVAGLTTANFTLSLNGENVPLDGVSIVQTDALTYVLSGIDAAANGAYTLSLDMAGLVKKSTGLACSGIQSTGWTVYHADPPSIVSTSIDSDQIIDGLTTFSIVFSSPMNCNDLIESGSIIQAVRIVEVDSDNNIVRFITLDGDDFQYIENTNTLVWNSAAPLSEGGNYRLVLDAAMLKSEEGVALGGTNAETQHSYQASEPSELPAQTQDGGYSVPVWYDYDGDGKLDLIVGEKATTTEGRIRVLLNVGTSESPAFGDYTYLPGASGDWTIAAENCLGVAPRFADVDGDGTDDLVFGTSDGRIEYARNNNGVFGSGISLLADGTAIDVGNRAVFDLVDWNGDGALDIVSGAMDGKVYLFVNNGGWTFSAAQTLSVQLENGWSAPAVADLDGDGDWDIVSGDANGNLYRFLNNGDGTFAAVDVTAGESGRSRPFVCDVNGDGILDITVGYASGKVSVLYGEEGKVVAEDFRINSSPVFSGTPSAQVEDYRVTLSWEPASDDVGVSGYKVRIGDTEYQTAATTLILTDVDIGTHTYQVGAYDEAGLENWSSPGIFEVKDVTPPVLDGIPSEMVWKNTVRFSWSPASDNVAVAGYRVELNGQTYDTALTSQFVSGLDLGDYEYRVGAIDTSGLITWSGKQSFSVTEQADTLDHTLTETVPTADYGPGCVASSIGMLLGYYDKYGYCGFDVSDLIPGEIEPESRNAADALLNAFIATPGYTSRFIGKTESAERPYTLTEQNELNTAAWDSLADWLGTGQKWRGNEDYATAYYYGSLDDVKESQDTYSVSGTALPVKFADFKYGLSLFVESVDYRLDGELTRTVKADTEANGTFSFADYAAEIDAGRGVLVSLASAGNLGHMVLGYGYNESTGEIIFDDTSESGRRMLWNGTYQYAGHEYSIQSVTTVVLDTDGLKVIEKTAPVITLTGDNTTSLLSSTLTAEVDDGSTLYYRTRNTDEWMEYTEAITVTANGTYFFKVTDAAGNTGTAEYVFTNILPVLASDVAPQTRTWETTENATQYIVEYSTDSFEHVIRLVVDSNSIDSFQMPAGNYQLRVKPEGSEDWTKIEEIVSEEENDAPKVVLSNMDGNSDLFFATPTETWSNLYYAKHVGSINDWRGTNDIVSAGGKGKIQNLFFGSTDPNVLCLTDADNGDAIFVDDIYTDLPDEVEDNTARLYKIQEVRAGAGDDIVDMTSQRFEYVGDGITIRGGDGDDVIWANKGSNFLFGDAGDDRIVGASGNDVIVGGIGKDRMHGGSGNDIFTFCDNWGEDTVEQSKGGSVTLWFASSDLAESIQSDWDAEFKTFTCTDGTNSVTVKGVAVDNVTLKFGSGTTPEDAARFAELSDLGAFDNFTSRKIFEESKGLFAGQ